MHYKYIAKACFSVSFFLPDCLVLLVSKERSAKERSSIVLDRICGLEAGGSSEGVAYALTILSLNQIVQLGFDSKEALLAWDLRLRYYLGEGEHECALAMICIFSDQMVFIHKNGCPFQTAFRFLIFFWNPNVHSVNMTYKAKPCTHPRACTLTKKI